MILLTACCVNCGKGGYFLPDHHASKVHAVHGEEFWRLIVNGHPQARCAPPNRPQLVLQTVQGSGTQGRIEKCHLGDGETEAPQSYASSSKFLPSHQWKTARLSPAVLRIAPAVKHLSYPSRFKNLKYFTLAI